MYSVEMEKILADPLSWIDSSWTKVPEIFCTGIPRGIFNKKVAQHFSLEKEAEFIGSFDDTRIFIENWSQLRESVWYMACQRYRVQLFSTSAPLLVGTKAKRFMLLNIVPARSWPEDIDILTLWKLAWLELCPLFSGLPGETVKCLRLLFPQEICDFNISNDGEFDFMLFRMAIQHARNSPA